MAIRVGSTTFLCLAICMIGCSVGDYESKMLDAQNRVARFEEGNRLLENTVVMPGRVEKGTTVQAINLFLRPPKGISTTAGKEKRAGILHTFGPSRPGGAAPFALVEIAYAAKEAKAFEKSVLEAFTASGQATRRSRQVAPLGRPPLTFSTVEFADSTNTYSINFFKGSTHQVAIVFWINPAGKAQAVRPIEVSLASFGVDGDASTARNTQGTPLVVPQHPN
jgi:hypothetical protein